MKRANKLASSLLLCALGLFLTAGAATAAPLPLVDYPGGIAIVADKNEGIDVQTELLGGPDGKKLCDEINLAISKRLMELEKTGKLPFRICPASELDKNLDASLGSVSGDSRIFVKAIAPLATSFDDIYEFRGEYLYKTLVVGGIDLVFIIKDSMEAHPRYLGTIPVWVHREYKHDNPRQVITDNEKRQIFRAAMLKAIAENTFDGARKAMKGIDAKAYGSQDECYQVTASNIKSENLKAVLGDNIGKVENIAANFYTSRFQQVSKDVIYPALPAKNRTLIEAVNASSNAGQLADAKIYYDEDSQSQAGKKITLEISGVSYVDMPDAKYPGRFDRGYQMWMKNALNGKPVNLGKDGEATRQSAVVWYEDVDGALNPEIDYILLAIELSIDAAEKAAKEMPKIKR